MISVSHENHFLGFWKRVFVGPRFVVRVTHATGHATSYCCDLETAKPVAEFLMRQPGMNAEATIYRCTRGGKFREPVTMVRLGA